MAEDGEQQGGAGPRAEGGEPPSEEELRAQLEEEIRKVRVEDVILQSVVSVLNLAARRIDKEDERDLAQGKLGIDAARAVVDLVPEEAQPQIRQAISELQLLYAKHAGEGVGGDDDAGGDSSEPAAKPKDGERTEGDSGLWTPPGS